MGKSVKHVIAIEEVEALRDRINAINNIPLANIVWTRGDNVIPVTQEAIDYWKFVGLSNASFAEMVLPKMGEGEIE